MVKAMASEVVTPPRESRYLKNRSLFGKNILVTRATGQADELSCLLKAHGADVLECPTIRIVPPGSYTALDNALKGLAAYDWVVFTSRNAVGCFVERLMVLNFDMRTIDSCSICAVGPKTAELLHGYGMRVKLIAEDFTGEGVVTAFAGQDMAGRRVLFPKGDLARDVVTKGLMHLGAHVDDPIAYRTVPQGRGSSQVLTALKERQIDCVTFTAPSTVRNFVSLLGEDDCKSLLNGVVVACIGPITSKACNHLGLKVHVEPGEYTIEAMVKEITRYFAFADSL